MGLLDDAIREHLELKRKRGGDPSEIERLEREALGPVRRTDDHAEAAEAVEAADAPLAEEPVAAPMREAEAADVLDDGADESEPVEPVEDLEPVAEAPRPEPPPVAEPPADSLAQPTVEFSVEEHLAGRGPEPDPDVVAADDDDEEDVLEETPDFLQETPEHDRLWFEQKPPRDFDFDG